MVQGALFPHVKPRAARPPSPTDVVLAEWRALWAAAYGRPLVFTTHAAWIQLKVHCKRAAALLPDADVRHEVLSRYLRLRDPYLTDHEHPLRLALWDERLRVFRKDAERVVAERRRLLAAAAPPAEPTGPPARWSVVERLNGNGGRRD